MGMAKKLWWEGKNGLLQKDTLMDDVIDQTIHNQMGWNSE